MELIYYQENVDLYQVYKKGGINKKISFRYIDVCHVKRGRNISTGLNPAPVHPREICF